MLNLEDRSYLLSITDLYINKKGRWI
jgi:hypothetical protein